LNEVRPLPKVALLRITERERGVPSERDLDLNRNNGVQDAAFAHEARGAVTRSVARLTGDSP